MEKLKTLKDLDIIICERKLIDSGDDCLCIPNFKDELRQEAIKWINNLNDNIDDWSEGNLYTKLGIFDRIAEVPAIVRFIKHFLNITDEDLK